MVQPALSNYYDTSALSSDERRRASQLEALYGFPFPTELFLFWRWYLELDEQRAEAFHDGLGMSLVGPFDVLAGRFDGVELTYPAVLHWRFRDDPPEFVTIISGDTDGLHWGLWFDDHERQPPVVSSYYARDAFELEHSGDTIFSAVRRHLAWAREGTRENMRDEPEYVEQYKTALAGLDVLEAALPLGVGSRPSREVVPTLDGMGIVEPTTPELLEGKALWLEDRAAAARLLAQGYRDLGRQTLAAIVEAHHGHPILPRVSILDYPKGTFHILSEALARPSEVTVLEIADEGLEDLPDLSSMENLETLSLYGNELRGLPASLAACRSLRSINLFRNPIDTVPEVLYELPSLETVILPDGIAADDLDRLRKAYPDAEIR